MFYDNRRHGFPGMLFTNPVRFPDKPYWRIDDIKKTQAPQVRF
jgi:hypothetical protein